MIEEVLDQIEKFNTTPYDEKISNSKSRQETYLYMDTATAKDMASFVGYILRRLVKVTKSIKNILDPAFGSGNLTSHIILYNDIPATKIILNDKETELINKEIKLKNAKITHYDFLEDMPYDQKFDMIIFNPQIGGNYPLGESHLENSLKVHISEDGIEKHIASLGLGFKYDLTIDDTNKSIHIHSDDTTKAKMTEKLKDIKVLDYHDLYYSSKSSTEEGTATNIVKFRNTLSDLLKDSTIVVFHGDSKTFESLFADFDDVNHYRSGLRTGDLFVAMKSGIYMTSCYEKIGDYFKAIDCNQKQKQNTNYTKLDNIYTSLDDTYEESIQTYSRCPIAQVASTGGDSDDITQEDTKPPQKPPKEQLPFANFLIGKEQIYKEDKVPFANFLIGKEQIYKEDKVPFINFLKEQNDKI